MRSLAEDGSLRLMSAGDDNTNLKHHDTITLCARQISPEP